jgi:hypothetical protein
MIMTTGVTGEAAVARYEPGPAEPDPGMVDSATAAIELHARMAGIVNLRKREKYMRTPLLG